MSKDLICWDASALISFLKGDKCPQDRIQPIKTVLNCVEKETHQLVFSTLIYVEVLDGAMPAEAVRKFEGFIKNKNQVQVFALDIKIAKKARLIRDSTRIKTPDAVHIATTIISGAKLFHTFDEDLLKLNGMSEVDGIAITKCVITGISQSLF